MTEVGHEARRGHPPVDSGGEEVLQAGTMRSARVEALRAVAALSVVVAHCWQYAYHFGWASISPYWHRIVATAGNSGVELFFALSGYLIFRPFARRAFGAGPPVAIGNYARNRLLRIVPLYWVAVIVLLLATAHGGTATQWLRFMGFAQNFSGRTLETVDGPMWSVVVEVQFYVLLPLLASAIAAVARGSKAVAASGVLAAGVVSAAAMYHFGAHSPVWSRSLPATFYGFVPGMLLALLQIEWDQRRPAWVRSLVARRDVWLVVGLGLWLADEWFVGIEPPLTMVAAFLTVGAVVLPLTDGPGARVLDARPLALVGVASYSLYIWHVPVIAQLVKLSALGTHFLALLVVGLPASLVAAALSYAVVERPALRLRRTWATARRAPDPAGDVRAAQAAG